MSEFGNIENLNQRKTVNITPLRFRPTENALVNLATGTFMNLAAVTFMDMAMTRLAQQLKVVNIMVIFSPVDMMNYAPLVWTKLAFAIGFCYYN